MESGKNKPIIGKIIYGSIFVVLLPALLVAWAYATDKSVSLPPIESMIGGVIIGAFGASIMGAGMAAIYVHGDGLPMNAYPPARFVSEGIYRFLSHPIYTGFSILCFGAAIAAGSASGLWLVFPTVVIGCVALVQGYEKQATLDHFGEIVTKPLIRFPPNEEMPATFAGRASVLVLGVIPCIIFIQITRLIGASAGTIDPLPIESTMPFYQWAEPIYLSGFLLVLFVPFAAGTSRQLREFLIQGLAITGLAGLFFIAFPYSVPHRLVEQQNGFGELLFWEQMLASRALFALASQIAWTLLASKLIAQKRGIWRIVVFVWATLVIAAGFFTGFQTVLSVLAGIALFFFATKIHVVWELARTASEQIANSWTEWKFGPLRVIIHGIYAGAGAFVSLSIIGTLTGPSHVPYVMMIALLAIVISGLSAQWIEGSPKLLRPYGWYGGVAGSFLGALIAYMLGADVWLLIAAFCVGAPWVQAAGRLRCLVQGCCHGRETAAGIGIRYVHPASRVCRMTNLTGVTVHATPLYSILCNIVVAVIVARLWLSGASLTFIVGFYYILTGMGRFVEESYRGEPQTPLFGGLRLYQLFAMISVIGGILASMVGYSGYAPQPQFNWEAIAASACFGVFIWFAFGADFPSSNRRFARLT